MYYMYDEFFAQRLAMFREQKGVSARDMSLSIGQNPSYINTIETGRSLPSMSAFFYICEYLGITPKDFFDTDVNYPDMLKELVENCKKLDHKELQAINTIVRSMTR